MDTLGFFQRVLPDTGPYYAIIFKPGSKPAHKPLPSLGALAATVCNLDINPQYSVYFGCTAGQPSPGKKRCGFGSPDGQAKSLWIDIDCGEEKAAEGKGYTCKKDAAAAVLNFCKEEGIPAPMLVSSGGGVHCYWTLASPLFFAEWKPYAEALKKALAARGVLSDEAVTADFARILRPVGTHNKKQEPPRPVSVIHPGRVIELSELAALKERFPIEAGVPPNGATDDLNDDLTAHLIPNIPSSAVEAAKKCRQMALMRDTQGDVSYEHMRGVIGVIKHSTEGYPLAVEWTAKRAETGHAQLDTQTRYETWNAGPTTCEFFLKNNPTGCADCAFKGKIVSPIKLGQLEPAAAPGSIEATVNGVKMEVEIPKLPSGYEWTTNQLVRYIRNKDGLLDVYPFCRTLFYATHRMKKENEGFAVGLRMHLPDGRMREFDLNTGLIASPAKLMEELGHRGEIVQTNIRDASVHMAAYMRDQLEALKHQAEEMNTMTSFGWKDEMQSFLIGDRLYHRDGTIRKVLLGGYAQSAAAHFPAPRGAIGGYAKAVDFLYNRDNHEPMQYAFCSGFSSVLTPFGEDIYRGLLVAITSGTSGKGKTTVCMAAMYGFGDAKPGAMTIATESGATANSRYAQFGTYTNLPVLLDEYTNIEAEELSKLAYTVSIGSERKRMIGSPSGVKQAPQAEWATNVAITANMDLHGKLAQHTANSQAEAVRMIQIKIDEFVQPDLQPGVASSALTQMRLNMGTAGEAFVKFTVSNTDAVFGMIQKQLDAVGAHVPEPKYRFYRNHAACTLVAAKILKDLGVISFDLDKLFNYSIYLLKKLCGEVEETNTITLDDAISIMINELNPRILSTAEYRDGRDARGPEYGKRSTSQILAGRHIYGTGKQDVYAGRLYVVKKEMRDWALKHRLDANSMLIYARDHGFLVSDGERFNLTRGTEYAAAQVSCVVFDLSIMAGAMPSKAPRLALAGKSDAEREAKA